MDAEKSRFARTMEKKGFREKKFNPLNPLTQNHDGSDPSLIETIKSQNEAKRRKLAQQMKDLPPELFDCSKFCPLTGSYCRLDCVMYRKEKPPGFHCMLTEMQTISFFLKKLASPDSGRGY